jgi:hypothetical protein
MQVSLNPVARDLKKVNGDERYTPYQKEFPVDAVSELLWPNVLGGEERDWVTQSEGVHFKPLCFNVTHGYFVNLLRVRKSGVLSRHYHTNPYMPTSSKGAGITWNTIGWPKKAPTRWSRRVKRTP